MNNLPKLRYLVKVNDSTSWDSRIDDYRTYSYNSEPKLQYFDELKKIWRNIPVFKEKV